MQRSVLFRLAPFAVAATLATGFGAGLATAADAAPVADVTVTSSAVGPTAGTAGSTGAVVSATITVGGQPAAEAVLNADIPGTVATTGVKVDGTTAPAGTVTADPQTGPTRTALTVRLGLGANAAVGGVLDVGTHTVTIATDLAGRTDAPLRAKTTFDYLGEPAPAPGSTATIPLPDLAVSAGDGLNDTEDGVLPVSAGFGALFFAEVTPRGSGVTDSVVTIELPRGLELDADEGDEGVVRLDLSSDSEDDDYVPLPCTRPSASTVRCKLGKVTEPVDLGVTLSATGAAPSGSTGTLALTVLAANGLDATPADNTVRTKVRFVPQPHLRTHVTTAASRVELGSKARITISVTNEGSSATPVIGVVVAANSLGKPKDDQAHFEITGFTGRSNGPITGSGGESGGGSASASAAPGEPVTGVRVAAGRTPAQLLTRSMARGALQGRSLAARRGVPIDLRSWDVGTLAPGATATAVLTVRAKRKGPGLVAAFAASPDGFSTCLFDNATHPNRCPEYGQVKLRAVAGAGTNSDDDIAATGVPGRRWTGVALALLLVGLLAQYAGSRRYGIAGRHRG